MTPTLETHRPSLKEYFIANARSRKALSMFDNIPILVNLWDATITVNEIYITWCSFFFSSCIRCLPIFPRYREARMLCTWGSIEFYTSRIRNFAADYNALTVWTTTFTILLDTLQPWKSFEENQFTKMLSSWHQIEWNQYSAQNFVFAAEYWLEFWLLHTILSESWNTYLHLKRTLHWTKSV